MIIEKNYARIYEYYRNEFNRLKIIVNHEKCPYCKNKLEPNIIRKELNDLFLKLRNETGGSTPSPPYIKKLIYEMSDYIKQECS